MQNKRIVEMPPTERCPESHKLILRDRILVVIGANGSGKTRFGAWLESQKINLYHRVSAHRSLQFPERVQPTDVKEAERHLLFGSREEGGLPYRNNHRWRNNPATTLLDDFEPLVTFMVSESFSVSDQYRVSMKKETEYVAPPPTRLDLVKEVWEAVLPDRELVITGNRIEARNRKDSRLYHAKEMSDGERGIFHLIGEALSVPKDGLFIVDEPELHLHRAIQARLWDSIESARPDCTFVYITHDLGFAASRSEATKVWLREYSNDKWDWEEVPNTPDLPEPLLLEVLGSRRPVLFVEGDQTSLDFFIYGKVFPEQTVIPCGSCESVVHSTYSFAQMQKLHHHKCGGIIDNDGRIDADIKKLNRFGVAVLPVALIENLFLLESILVIAAKKLGHDPVDVVTKVKGRVFAALAANAVRVVSNLTRMEIEYGLRSFGKGGDGTVALTEAYKNACTAINPAAIYTKWEAEITRVLGEKDYLSALRYYKTKGLLSEAGNVFGIKFKDQIMRWLRGEHSTALVEALRVAVPEIPEATVA